MESLSRALPTEEQFVSQDTLPSRSWQEFSSTPVRVGPETAIANQCWLALEKAEFQAQDRFAANSRQLHLAGTIREVGIFHLILTEGSRCALLTLRRCEGSPQANKL